MQGEPKTSKSKCGNLTVTQGSPFMLVIASPMKIEFAEPIQ
uniref:Uncharacterized protein n=1 Tax=Rhizophora mucronata TaxID=61149 RepID=A0A2P2NWR3_RHIMU